jgi:hypothetical protein
MQTDDGFRYNLDPKRSQVGRFGDMLYEEPELRAKKKKLDSV